MTWRSLGSIWESHVDRTAKWHNWFAWFPVRIDNKVYWLTTVQRQVEVVESWTEIYRIGHYRKKI